MRAFLPFCDRPVTRKTQSGPKQMTEIGYKFEGLRWGHLKAGRPSVMFSISYVWGVTGGHFTDRRLVVVFGISYIVPHINSTILNALKHL